ncbi:MAG: hypothetical protein R3D05_17200 [Dongiaceae bacterium]
MIPLTVLHETIELEALERQEDQIGGAEARVRNTARAIVDQQAQAAQQRIDARRREAERQRDGMLLAGDGDQPFTDPRRCRRTSSWPTSSACDSFTCS